MKEKKQQEEKPAKEKVVREPFFKRFLGFLANIFTFGYYGKIKAEREEKMAIQEIIEEGEPVVEPVKQEEIDAETETSEKDSEEKDEDEEDKGSDEKDDEKEDDKSDEKEDDKEREL